MHFVLVSLGYFPDQVGGAYRYVAELAECLAARGRRVDVIYPGPPGMPAGKERRAGVDLDRIGNASGFFWNNWRRKNREVAARMAETLRSAGRDCLSVLCHAFFGPAVARAAHGPSAFLFTGPWAEEYLLSRKTTGISPPRRWFHSAVAARMRKIERSALAATRRILTLSEYYRDALPRWHGPGLPPVEIVSGGVNAQRFHPSPNRDAGRRRFQVGPDEFLFLAVRRLEPRMGLPILVEAFARVAPEFPHARLWMGGSGPQRDEIEMQVNRLGMNSRIRLLGHVPESDLPALLNAADCGLVPSIDLEGFGLATVEMLACGTPVLGSRAGATPELLRGLDEGLLFTPGSTDALANRMGEILSQPDRLPSRRRCAEFAARHFAWSSVAARFETAYESLMSGGVPA
jgi:glycosyltransferase involved in cell wall biosynthesis